MSAPTPLAAARWYRARLGWAPIPVPDQAKAPVLKEWQALRLAEADLPRFFGAAPQNVGILLGAPSGGLADVDLDGPEARLLAEAFLPPTGRVCGRASAPRSHWFFVVEGDPRTERFRDPLAAMGDERAVLVELRWTGCQTLVPPSVHPSGEPVVWEERGDPGQAGAAELRTAVARLAAAALLARRWPAEGARQDAALALAGALLHAGWSEEETEAFVAAVVRAAGDGEARKREATVRYTARAVDSGRNTTGWPTLAGLVGDQVGDAVRGWLGLRDDPRFLRIPRNDPHGGDSADSAENAAGPEPWEPPVPLPVGERPPWPEGILPDPLAPYVAALAWATQTPPALAAVAVLGTLAAACAKRVAVVVRPGWREPVNLYLLVALPPGNRKSAVVAAAGAPLREYEAAEARRLGLEVALATQRRELADARLDKLKGKAAGEEDPDKRAALQLEIAQLTEKLLTDPELRVPTVPRLLVDDVTPEKLAALMAEQGGRLAVLSAEGGIFKAIAGRYSDKRAESLDLFLKGHSGDDLPIDRIGRPAKHLRSPALTLALAVQPEVLAGLAGEKGFRGTGLLARFAWACPVSTVGHRRIAPDPVPEAVKDAYENLVLAVLGLPGQADADGSPRPRDLMLSEAAEARLRRFEGELEPRLGPDGGLAHVADWGAKLAGLVARVAGLLHVAAEVGTGERPWDRDIQEDTINAAVRLAEEFLVPHALTAFGAMGGDPALEGARRVLRALARWPEETVTRRDLHRSALKGSFPTADALDRPLALLAEHGFVRPLPAPDRSSTRGRKPSQAFAINPLWHPRNPRNPRNGDGEGENADSAENADKPEAESGGAEEEWEWTA